MVTISWQFNHVRRVRNHIPRSVVIFKRSRTICPWCAPTTEQVFTSCDFHHFGSVRFSAGASYVQGKEIPSSLKIFENIEFALVNTKLSFKHVDVIHGAPS